MDYKNTLNKFRQWDNKAAQWMMKHFYILFFEFILVGIFVAIFINAVKLIDISLDMSKASMVERLLANISTSSLLIVILLIFNSFWMLYIFSSLIRMRGILKNIDFNISRQRGDKRSVSRDEYSP